VTATPERAATASKLAPTFWRGQGY
jgi:hypothetical protein